MILEWSRIFSLVRSSLKKGGVPCAPLMDKKDFEEKLQCDDLTMCVPFVNIDENHIETEMPLEMLEVELKKELDLVEMMSQINNEILHV